MKFKLFVHDKVEYEIEADSLDEAVEQAYQFWYWREPIIEQIENKE